MNENHQRHVLTTFRHIASLLSETEHLLTSRGSSSPFVEYRQDISPEQRTIIKGYLERTHETLRRAMAELKLPQPEPMCGALWAARNSVDFARIAVAEIEPKRMHGYGALSEADAKALESVAARLCTALEEFGDYLARR